MISPDSTRDISAAEKLLSRQERGRELNMKLRPSKTIKRPSKRADSKKSFPTECASCTTLPRRTQNAPSSPPAVKSATPQWVWAKPRNAWFTTLRGRNRRKKKPQNATQGCAMPLLKATAPMCVRSYRAECRWQNAAAPPKCGRLSIRATSIRCRRTTLRARQTERP